MSAAGVVELRFTSHLAAPADKVWRRVTSQDGLDHEFSPWLRMRFPAELRGSSLEDLPVGRPVGRAWMLLGGVLPVDYDDLCLVEVVPGSHFLERSTLASARSWQHERRLEPLPGGGTRLTDALVVQPRLRPLSPVSRAVVRLVFEHRHRRLRAWWGEEPRGSE